MSARLLGLILSAPQRFILPLVSIGVFVLLLGYPLLSFLGLAVFPHLFGQSGAGDIVSLQSFADALA
ncbi:MAG: hypothetical protein KGH84_10070, partial [Paracoccaceae bacterium]|nr:hypothetical protein [Paracoccaceae bacterium]